MTLRTQARRRAVMAVALLVLVLALALAACGGRGARRDNGSAANSGVNTTQQQGGQLSGAASNVVSADQDIQAAMRQLDAAQSDAGTDLSAQDSPVEP
jgi:hypothetical protein